MYGVGTQPRLVVCNGVVENMYYNLIVRFELAKALPSTFTLSQRMTKDF